MKTLFTDLLSMPLEMEILSTAGEMGTVAISGPTQDNGSKLTVSITALFATNSTRMMFATALVFIMHPGFVSVEAGFTQAKKVNILYESTSTILIGLLSYLK